MNSPASWHARAIARPVPWLGGALLLATSIKLWLALTTFGTNDVRYWQTFAQYLAEHGSVTIYRDIWYYNHPPMVSAYLRLLHALGDVAPNGFPFLIRIPAILADMLSTVLVYRLVKFCWDERRAFACALGVALSPILVLVSGFHGNTDPVFLCLILLSLERAVIARAPASAGLLLGLAINVKLVPLIVVPVLFFHFPAPRERARFAIALAAVVVAGFGYHFVAAYPYMAHNVFAYSGLAGIWGVTELAAAGFPGIVSRTGIALAKMLILLSIVGRALWFWWRSRTRPPAPRERDRETLRATGWAFVTFLLLTPGFGVQYLSWLAIAAFLIDPWWAVGWNLLGGAFAFSVYDYWNRGWPWFIADSDKIGRWQAPQALLGRIAWIYLLAWAIVAMHAAVVRRTALRD